MNAIIHRHWERAAHRYLYGWECPKCRRFGRQIYFYDVGAARAFRRHANRFHR